MKPALIAACILLGLSTNAFALCKYKAADGSWTYSKTCREKPEKEIDGSASMILKKNAEYQDAGPSVEGRRLRGYEYSDTTHSGMRIKMVEPNKAPPEKEFTSQ